MVFSSETVTTQNTLTDTVTDFVFFDPGSLVDGDFELVLRKTCPANQERGLVPEYKFEMRLVNTPVKIGDISFRVGYTEKLNYYGGNIGYNVEPAYRGHHYAARSCLLLLPLARRHGLNPIWITCDPDNWASRRTCELVGATLIEIRETEIHPNEYRIKCRYRLDLSL